MDITTNFNIDFHCIFLLTIVEIKKLQSLTLKNILVISKFGFKNFRISRRKSFGIKDNFT